MIHWLDLPTFNLPPMIAQEYSPRRVGWMVKTHHCGLVNLKQMEWARL